MNTNLMYVATRKSDDTYEATLRTQDSRECMSCPDRSVAVCWLIEGALALNGVCISEQDIQFFKEAVQIVPEKTYRDEEGHVYTRLLDGCHKLYSVAPFGGHNVKFAVGNFQGSLSFYNDLLTAQRVWERVNQPDLQDLTGAVVRAERILGIRV